MTALPEMVLVCTAWRRPRYLARTLESWSKARGIGELGGLVVALGNSPVRDQQLEVIDLAARAMSLDDRAVVRFDSPAAEASPGMHRALGETLEWVTTPACGAKAVICAEEDIIVSDDVLEYMTWALTRFADDPAVAAVCAHDVGGQGWDIPGIGQQGLTADQHAVTLQPYFNPWVWATWTGPKLQMLLDTWDWDATSGPAAWQHGYDWQILRQVRSRGLRCVVPCASRSQNIGRDGGYYARPELFDQTQAASFRKHRDPAPYTLTGEPS